MKFWKPSVERDAFSVPRSVQKSIPIKRVYKDGIFEVSGKFSKTWRFFDVNYKVASPEKQEDLFKAYCAFLNTLPVNATAKITLFNRRLNQREFNANLFMPYRRRVHHRSWRRRGQPAYLLHSNLLGRRTSRRSGILSG